MDLEKMEHDETLRTFGSPQDTFDLMWAPFYQEVLKREQGVPYVALKGFCRSVVQAMLAEK